MRIFLSLAATMLVISGIRAQEPPVTTPEVPGVPGQKKAAPEKTLRDLLTELRWPARTRGPLLLVAPERLRVPESVLSSAQSREGVSLTTLAPLTKQKIERYDTLSVLAPLTMPVISLPSEFQRMVRAGMRYGSAKGLLGILSETQWELVTSESGLGRANLINERQRSAWDAMLPPQVTFMTTTPQPRSEKPGLLSPVQIDSLRLRVSRRLTVKVSGGYWLSDDAWESGGQVGYVSAILDPEFLDKDGLPDMTLLRNPMKSGEAPYLRKKTDLDPAQLQATISLSGLNTVGELVARIAKASNVELYVDRRLGSVPIAVATEPDQGVRAGDALAAVIRATTTAVRAINTGRERAFVLTHDRIPLAVTSTEVSDAMLPIMAEQLSQTTLSRGSRLPDIWDRIPRRERTPNPDSLWKKGEEPDSKPFPVSELPTPLQQRARKLAEDLAENSPTAKLDTVTVQAEAVIELIAPFWGGATASVGTLPMKSFRRQPDLPLTLLPTAPKIRALQVELPRTATERTRLLSLTAERGFTTLVIPLSGDTREDALFTALAQEAQARKLTLIPTLCPLQPAPSDTTLERDLSLTGRSATEMNAGRSLGIITEAMPPLSSLFRRITQRDFITPEVAPLSTFARRAAALSALPGVTDIVLAEVVAPGYGDRQNADFDYLWSGGATPAARLAMLRRDGFDPMDIGHGISGTLAPPLFEDTEPDNLLRKFRLERREAYLKRLDTALKATGLRARLWVAPLLTESGMTSQEQFVSPWQGKLPAQKPPANAFRFLDHAAVTMMAMNQQMDTPTGEEEPNLTRRWLGGLFEKNNTPNFVLDFSDIPLGDALKLVETTIAKKPQ